jgi:hypothetical protein
VLHLLLKQLALLMMFLQPRYSILHFVGAFLALKVVLMEEAKGALGLGRHEGKSRVHPP